MIKVKEYVSSIPLRFRTYAKRFSDSKLAWAEGYAKGVDEATITMTNQLNALTNRMSELSQENLNMEEKLRGTYDERLGIIDRRYTDKCKECMKTTESERERLRKTQNMMLDLIQKFNIVFMKVFKHANLVVDEHDTIIKSSGRVKASRDILLSIKTEADEIIKKALPLVGIQITELSKDKDPIHLMEEIIETKTKSKEKIN